MTTFIVLLFVLALLATVFVGLVWAFSALARFVSALLPPDTDPSVR